MLSLNDLTPTVNSSKCNTLKLHIKVKSQQHHLNIVPSSSLTFASCMKTAPNSTNHCMEGPFKKGPPHDTITNDHLLAKI